MKKENMSQDTDKECLENGECFESAEQRICHQASAVRKMDGYYNLNWKQLQKTCRR